MTCGGWLIATRLWCSASALTRRASSATPAESMKVTRDRSTRMGRSRSVASLPASFRSSARARSTSPTRTMSVSSELKTTALSRNVPGLEIGEVLWHGHVGHP